MPEKSLERSHEGSAEGSSGESRLIDSEQVRHIAYLIRLALTDEEVEMFSEQLSTIVDYFDRLAEINVEGVPAYRQPQMSRARLREDTVQPSMRRDDFLANAPQHQDGLVRVPVVLGAPTTDEA
jgi:aspartyl-tRNA(Asn)/glutamyl-tRNA(Gln) amidotransferase subunit C